MGVRFRALLATALVSVLAAGLGVWIFAGTGGSRHIVVDGVPLDEVHPSGGGHHPGVVVAHGFAGSARLMAPFGDTLSARGYVVVLLDFAGHGTNTRPLPDATASTGASDKALQQDLDVALAHLRSLPDVDPSRLALVGHSMGATAVTRYAESHPGVKATVAISLPDSSDVPPDRPARLLLLAGGLEFANFRTAALRAAEGGGADRAAVIVPGVEHISILYAPRTHREVGSWLDASLGEPAGTRSAPSPIRRVGTGGLLLLAFLLGLYPLAWVLFGGRPARWPRVAVSPLTRVVIVAAVAAVVGALMAPLLPTINLPLALGGYVVGFTLTAGIALLAYHRWRTGTFAASAPVAPHGWLRLAVATPVLIGYAAVAIALPLQLGVTNAIPVGARWWLLAAVWAGFAVLSYAAECVAGGNSLGVLAVSAVTVIALTGAAAVGLTSGFLLLVVPLLAILLVWQAIWSAMLHRFSAPPLLIALVGSLVVAWPIATALPVVG
jgi:dienelactone hydrolase